MLMSFRYLQVHTTLKLAQSSYPVPPVLDIYKFTLLSNIQYLILFQSCVLDIYKFTLLSNIRLNPDSLACVLDIYKFTLLSN